MISSHRVETAIERIEQVADVASVSGDDGGPTELRLGGGERRRVAAVGSLNRSH